MGLIRKQSIEGTIYTYLGVVLGFVTTGLLMPDILKTDQIGLFRILVSVSILFAQFSSLGFNLVTVKVFPHFRNEAKKHHGYLGLALLAGLIGFILSVLILFLLKPILAERYAAQSSLFIDYFYLLIPLIFFHLLFSILDTYYRVLFDTVKGTIYKEFIQRLVILVLLIAFYYEQISFHQLTLLYAAAICLPALLLLGRLISQGKFSIRVNWSTFKPSVIRNMMAVSLFGLIGSFSGVIAVNIDSIMVNDQLGLSLAGVYSITFFFGSLVLIPSRALNRIGSVVIADAWKRGDMNELKDIYYKSSITLSVLGFYLLGGLLINHENIFEIIKNPEYYQGKAVIYLIGLASLIDLTMGVSQQLMFFTKYHKELTYIILVYMILMVVLNFLFIREFGITGAALATLIAKIIQNLTRWVFLKRKFRFQPIKTTHLVLFAGGLLIIWISLLLPKASHYILDIGLRSLFFSLLYFIFIYFSKISFDINQSVVRVIHFIFKRKLS